MKPFLMMMGAGSRPKTGSVLVSLGNSILRGGGSGGVTTANRLTARLCGMKGWTEDNRAVDSTTIEHFLSDPSLIPSFGSNPLHRNIVFGTPINDYGFGTSSTPAEYRAKLIALFTLIHEKGWEKRRIYGLSGTYATDANWADYGTSPMPTTEGYLEAIAAAEEGAAEYGVNHTDLYGWMEDNGGDSIMDSYGRHPLDTATAAIAVEWEARHSNW